MKFYANPVTLYADLVNYTHEHRLRLIYHHSTRFEYLPLVGDELVELVRWVFPRTIIVALVYLVLCFILKTLMSFRHPFTLRTPLMVWNASLALFSWIGFWRASPELFYILRNYSVYHSLCFHYAPDSVTEFWSAMYLLSKYVEMGDTVFVLLRKKPLIFLHYYHHAVVLVVCCHSGAESTAAGRWYMWCNLLTHALMYTYYAVTASGWRLPRSCSMMVTTLQVVQMYIGCWVVFSVHYYKWMGIPCQQSDANLFIATIMYLSFNFLFCKFFFDAYLRKKSSPLCTTTMEQKAEEKKND